MAIDLTAENPIPLAVAARLVPPARSGKRTHLSTLLRWILAGAMAPDGTRVRLEAVRLGGRWMTSREAIQRFAASLTPHIGDETTPPRRSEATRSRASERAAAELARRGV
jgi:hypothetical protein